jgi:cobalt-zinc-cadmium efflux system outer membrane protein
VRSPPHRRPRTLSALALGLLAPAACASAPSRVDRDLLEVERALRPVTPHEASTSIPDAHAVALDGSLRAYLSHAFAHSPALRATFEQWRAATYGPATARRLDEPIISYTWFIGGMDTPMGPQRHRVGVMQMFPWPTKIRAASRAEELAAAAAQRRFEAHALELAAVVARAYWRLWQLRRARELQRAQLDILRSVSELVRIRVTTGEAGLGALAQVDLQISRSEDELLAFDQRERAAVAELRWAIGGAAPALLLTTDDPPPPRSPSEPQEQLQGALSAHPEVNGRELLARAGAERARAAGADRYPSLGLGFDWTQIGPARDPTHPHAGRDMFMLQTSLKIPIWGAAYRAAIRQAEAEGAAEAAEARAARDRAAADLEAVLSDIEDSARRIRLYTGALAPQAETARAALQSSYQVGRAALSDLLLLERDLIDLEAAHLQARVDHALAWAELERIVGRPVAAQTIE